MGGGLRERGQVEENNGTINIRKGGRKGEEGDVWVGTKGRWDNLTSDGKSVRLLFLVN